MNESGENQHKQVPRKRVDVVTIKMVKESSVLYSERKITNDTEAVQILRDFVGESDREHFVALFLNVKKEPTAIHTVGIGTLNGALVHPREVFKAAILSNAASVIVCHNHPSGTADPSQEDRVLTKQLVEAGQILGIEVLDHIILGDSTSFSFKKEGQL